MPHSSTGPSAVLAAPSSARDAAFGAHPDGGPVVRAVPADPLGRWLTAVALGGQGHYAAAWTILARLLTDPAVPPAVAAHAAVTRASHLRQMGGHARARSFDAQALRRAALCPPIHTGVAPVHPPDGDGDGDGVGLLAARLDALVGLAADAVGVGDTGAARRLLDAAAGPIEEHPSWRLRVRRGWVRAELALLRGRPGEAVAPAAAALEEATAGGSRRHELKSRIVLGVSTAAADGSSARVVVEELAAVERECAERGLLPLCWPAASAAADLLDRNDARTGSAGGAPCDRPSDAARRRHAAALALTVVYSRSDPVIKRQMGESMWQPVQSTVM